MLLNHGDVDAVRSTDGIPGTLPVSGTGVLAVTAAGSEHESWSGSAVSMPPGSGTGTPKASNLRPLTGLGAPGRAPVEPAPPFAPHQLSRALMDNGTRGTCRDTRTPKRLP